MMVTLAHTPPLDQRFQSVFFSIRPRAIPAISDMDADLHRQPWASSSPAML